MFLLAFIRVEGGGFKIGISRADQLTVVVVAVACIVIGLGIFLRPLSPKAFAEISNDVQELEDRGQKLSKDGRYSESIHIYQKITYLISEDTRELSVLTDKLYKLGNYQGAAITQREIVSILDKSQDVTDQERAEAALKYSDILYRAGDYEEAGLSATGALLPGNNDFVVHKELCAIYLNLDQEEKSVNACNQALVEDPGTSILGRAWLWYVRGLALEKAEDRDKALESLLFSYSLLGDSSGTEEKNLKEEIRSKVNEYDPFLTKDLLVLLKESKTEEKIPAISQESDSETLNASDGSDGKTSEKAEEKIEEKKDELLDSISNKLPLDSCGTLDSDVGSKELYPIFVEYTEATLEKVRKDFCRDAFKSSERDIQVASLKSESSALRLQKILKRQFGNARIGKSEPH